MKTFFFIFFVYLYRIVSAQSDSVIMQSDESQFIIKSFEISNIKEYYLSDMDYFYVVGIPTHQRDTTCHLYNFDSTYSIAIFKNTFSDYSVESYSDYLVLFFSKVDSIILIVSCFDERTIECIDYLRISDLLLRREFLVMWAFDYKLSKGIMLQYGLEKGIENKPIKVYRINNNLPKSSNIIFDNPLGNYNVNMSKYKYEYYQYLTSNFNTIFNREIIWSPENISNNILEIILKEGIKY